MKNKSLFSTGNFFKPHKIIDAWLNPYACTATTDLDGNKLLISWTKRAQQAFDKLASPLTVEMQLYFSCVVKKRVLFHQNSLPDTTPINQQFGIIFRPVEANSCDPEEFARNYPAKKQMQSAGAIKMHPRQLILDYKKGNWAGEFMI